MKVGNVVRFKTPLVQGPIAQRRINEEHDEPECLIVFKDEQGEVHQRWALETQLELVEAPEAPKEAA